MRPRGFVVWILALGLIVPISALAEHTRIWRQSEFSEFERGTANGVAIRSESRLSLGPARGFARASLRCGRIECKSLAL
jgi:hypothetical protein